MDPKNVGIMNDLSKLYKENERFEDQIFILEKFFQLRGIMR